jgi:hypothetical protein
MSDERVNIPFAWPWSAGALPELCTFTLDGWHFVTSPLEPSQNANHLDCMH